MYSATPIFLCRANCQWVSKFIATRLCFSGSGVRVGTTLISVVFRWALIFDIISGGLRARSLASVYNCALHFIESRFLRCTGWTITNIAFVCESIGALNCWWLHYLTLQFLAAYMLTLRGGISRSARICLYMLGIRTTSYTIQAASNSGLFQNIICITSIRYLGTVFWKDLLRLNPCTWLERFGCQ